MLRAVIAFCVAAPCFFLCPGPDASLSYFVTVALLGRVFYLMATALCIPRRFVLMFRFACLLSGWSILFAHSAGIQPERWWRGSLQVYAAWLGLHGVGLMRANKRLRTLETYFHHRAEETESKVHGQVEQYAEVG